MIGAELFVYLGQGLPDLLQPDLARGHGPLALELGLREPEGVEAPLALRVDRRDALPLLLLFTLGHPLLEAVFGIDQSFSGVTHPALLTNGKTRSYPEVAEWERVFGCILPE